MAAELSQSDAIAAEPGTTTWAQPSVAHGDIRPSELFTQRVSIGFARRAKLLGLEAENGDQFLLVEDHKESLENVDAARRTLGIAAPVIENTAYGQQQHESIDMGKRIDQAYTSASHAERHHGDGMQATHERELVVSTSDGDLLSDSSSSDVVQLVNRMLREAVVGKASDVHIQPYESHLRIRMRLDGVLRDWHETGVERASEIVSRIKVMGRMDVAHKRRPQDGRATVRLGAHAVDLRIATLPTAYGERVVIRLLDREQLVLSLDALGMPDGVRNGFDRMVRSDHGIVLVTGPTGSGKTTTLYAALRSMDCQKQSIVTLEDPIEYRLEGISQSQVNEKQGLSFADGLRSILRQDPDVIMVGEIRDRETAMMAVQASLTGHLVLATLHTNDSVGALTRLVDLGVPPFLVSSAVTGVLAQRLVRSVCSACGNQETGQAVSDPVNECAVCQGSGFAGRQAVFELLLCTEAIQSAVVRQASVQEVRLLAKDCGLVPLAEAARALVGSGVTTSEEVERVVMSPWE